MMNIETALQEIGEKLARIDERLRNIEGNLDEDYKVLHGNGHPGLVTRVTELECSQKNSLRSTGYVLGGIGFIINAVIALYAAFKHTS